MTGVTCGGNRCRYLSLVLLNTYAEMRSWRGEEQTYVRLDASLDGYAGHAQDVSDFGLLQARCVIFKRQLIELLVDLETPQAIGVGELAESAELFGAQRPLQFVGYFHQGHNWIIATRGPKRLRDFPSGKTTRLRREAELIVGSSKRLTDKRVGMCCWWKRGRMRREDG